MPVSGREGEVIEAPGRAATPARVLSHFYLQPEEPNRAQRLRATRNLL